VLNSFNLSSGTVKYDMKQISFKDIVNQVISEKKSRAEDKGLNIETEMNLEDSYNILGDAFWIKEVVNNFIENSIRYSLTGTIHIKLEKKDHKIVLSVKDNGVGLTDEDKKNLFTEGGRGKDSIRMNIDSTGYGLFSVKLIVQAHKGRVWAESEGKDKGSTFFVELDEVVTS
jgi:signal transduction histidine kinase